jgi:hypothetical protein
VGSSLIGPAASTTAQTYNLWPGRLPRIHVNVLIFKKLLGPPHKYQKWIYKIKLLLIVPFN